MLYLRHKHFEGQGLSRAENRARGSEAAHALLKDLLTELRLPCALKTSAAGRPFLENCQTVDFNISHTSSLAVCALLQAENAPRVGVDAEDAATLDKTRIEALTARFFAPCEQKAWQAAADKTACFLSKYIGDGLGAHLSSTDTMREGFEAENRVRFYTYREGTAVITLCLPQHVTELPITTLCPYTITE